MIGFINLLTKIFIWIIRICKVWYRRLHWFHKELAINSVHIFTIRHSRKMHRHQRILIVSQWTDVEIRWNLTNKAEILLLYEKIENAFHTYIVWLNVFHENRSIYYGAAQTGLDSIDSDYSSIKYYVAGVVHIINTFERIFPCLVNWKE